MTDTLQAPAVAPEPAPLPPSRNTVTVAVAVLAVVAVIALAVVAIVAVTNRDNTHTRMMGTNGIPGSMGSSQMMNGSMMNGPMMNGPMLGQGSSNPTVPGAREIAITATSFRFAPAEIHVRAGENVTIVLTAIDVAHDFTVDGLGFHVAAAPGQPVRGGLQVPSTSGRYTAYCSVAGHRQAGMTATVVVDGS